MVELDKLVVKFIWKFKAKSVLTEKKNRLLFPNHKIYKAIELRQCAISTGIDKWINKVKQSETDARTYKSFIYKQRWLLRAMKKQLFSSCAEITMYLHENNYV